VRPPGDKSISHRYALIAAIAHGRTRIAGFAPGADAAATLACLRRLGVAVVETGVPSEGPTVEIVGRGLRGLEPPSGPLDAANSGTTLRLLAGILAAHPFASTLTGDASLSRRPMRRIIEPLERMGARIESRGGYPPLVVHGAALHGLSWRLPVPSAQVKSAVLLAGLQADGATDVEEPAGTRDHTERALAAFGAALDVTDRRIRLEGGQRLEGRSLAVPGDFSSAAFWLVAAAALPGSDVEVVDVGLNPTRTALLDVLRRAGALVDAAVERETAGEPVGSVRVRHHDLRRLEIAADEVPALIDELPVLAVLGAYGGGIRVTGAGELRVKESDRIAALVAGLRGLGAEAEELHDGFEVGPCRLPGGTADAAGDHRLAMAFAVAALGAAGPSTILGADAVGVSYPGFFAALEALRA
jgi:3-phosphoshikimate 1-carboxyvinyltransferase